MIATSANINLDFNIANLFFQAAKRNPTTIAIIEKEQEITFEDLAQEVKATAAYFHEKGIRKGDRVLIFVPMSIDLYRMVLALFYLGATAVFLDEWVSRKRLDLCCEIAQCKAFIGGWKVRFLALFSKSLRKVPIRLGLNHIPSKQESFNPLPTKKSDTALITFTTGSTGTPKAAKRTHGFLYEQFKALEDKIDPQETDVDMPILPIVLLINLGVGCTSVIADFNARKPEQMNSTRIIQQMKTHRVNRLVASPFVVKQLAQSLLQTNDQVYTLEKVFTGGAPVFPKEARLYAQAFPNTKVEIVYGSTEAEPISAIEVENLIQEKTSAKGLNVGIPYHKTAVRILPISDEPIQCETEDDLLEMSLPKGTIGEIVVSGAHVLREYINNEKALKRNKIFIEDTCWHRTGDSGFIDENGQLFLTGRCSSLIKTNTGIIAPFVVENYLQTLEGVVMGTLIQKNNEIIAVVELENGTNESSISDPIKAFDKRISQIHFIEKMPRDPRHNSKIDYERLKEIIS